MTEDACDSDRRPSVRLLQLSPFTLMDVATWLSPTSVLRWTSTCRSLRWLAQDQVLWQRLLDRDYHPDVRHAALLGRGRGPSQRSSTPDEDDDVAPTPESFQHYKRFATGYRFAEVEWRRFGSSNGPSFIAQREGHVQCALDDTTVFLRGGFTHDPKGYLFDITEEMAVGLSGGERFVYGHRADCTGVDEVCTFGGCTAGGYSGMLGTFTVTTIDRARQFLRDRSVDLPSTAIAPRAYHGQCYDRHEGILYVFGGLLEGGRTNAELFALDVPSLRKTAFANESGSPPAQASAKAVTKLQVDLRIRPRFGHSMAMVRRKLYIAGGYTGSGVFQLHDGEDLFDLYEHCLETGVTRCLFAHGPADSLGRCHTVAVYGPLLLYYGGTVEASSELTVFDTQQAVLFRPTKKDYTVAAAHSPNGTQRFPWMRQASFLDSIGRVAHAATLVGTQLLVTGGCRDDQPMFAPQIADLTAALDSPFRHVKTVPAAEVTPQAFRSRDPPIAQSAEHPAVYRELSDRRRLMLRLMSFLGTNLFPDDPNLEPSDGEGIEGPD